MSQSELQAAYDHCLKVAKQHYENFPVASWILPRRLRLPIAVIYTFARSADDFADEGDLSVQERLTKLDDYVTALDAIKAGTPSNEPVFIALAAIISQHHLPLELFYDLLTAFRQDVTKKRYENFDEVMDYCQNSANPIGRLLLYLYGTATPENLKYSDAVCSALQLINFWQDIYQDFSENDRIYLPQDEMVRFNVSESHIQDQNSDAAMQSLMAFQIQRTRNLLQSGAPLGNKLKGRIGLVLRMIMAGGLRILEKLEENTDDLFARPRLKIHDRIWMFTQAALAP